MFWRKNLIKHDNLLFKLHRQANFFVLLFGVISILVQNYLNYGAILCKGQLGEGRGGERFYYGDQYNNNYCWYNAKGQLRQDISESHHEDTTSPCFMALDEMSPYKNLDATNYIQIPIILIICMGLIKIPMLVWKTIFERGIMASLVGDETQTGEKVAVRFINLKKKSSILVWYHICFIVCELLNLVMLLICFQIVNSFLDNQFWSYGLNVETYYRTRSTENSHNPMCNLFPTNVYCTQTHHTTGGSIESYLMICILSGSLFNQSYFLILWCWWILLIVVSLLGIIYRVAQMFVPSVTRAVLQTYLTPLGLEEKAKTLSLGSADCFLLGRLANNVKRDIMKEVLNEARFKTETKEDGNMTSSV